MPTRPPNLTLATLLREVGWSPYDLARAVNRALAGSRRIHATTPFTWRDRGVVPRHPLPSVVAGVLSEAHGRVISAQELWPDLPVTAGAFAASTDGLDVLWSPPQSLRLLDRSRSRGSFFALAGSDLIDVARQWTQPHHQLLPANRRGTGEVTPELIDYLAADIAALRRLDDGHGGRLVLHAAGHQLDLAGDLLRNSSYSLREGWRLASVVGQLAQLSGWLNFDLANHGHAQRLYLLGLRAAALAGDRELGALILSSLAFQQSWRNRPADAITLLHLATIGNANPGPRTRALLSMREARPTCPGVLRRATLAVHVVNHAERIIAARYPDDLVGRPLPAGYDLRHLTPTTMADRVHDVAMTTFKPAGRQRPDKGRYCKGFRTFQSSRPPAAPQSRSTAPVSRPC